MTDLFLLTNNMLWFFGFFIVISIIGWIVTGE